MGIHALCVAPASPLRRAIRRLALLPGPVAQRIDHDRDYAETAPRFASLNRVKRVTKATGIARRFVLSVLICVAFGVSLPMAKGSPWYTLWAPKHRLLMKSFLQLAGEMPGWREDEFYRKVFWRCLHRHAIPLVPLLGGYGSDYFAADREFISRVAGAVNMRQVRHEVRAYFTNPANRSWLRMKANVRVSAHRVMRLASKHLPGADTIHPFEGVEAKLGLVSQSGDYRR